MTSKAKAPEAREGEPTQQEMLHAIHNDPNRSNEVPEVPPAPPEPPAITSIVPEEVTIGDPDATLQVLGTGFTEASVIKFDGADVGTTYVSATELTTGIFPSLATEPALVAVTVANGELVSAPVEFEMLPVDPPVGRKTKARR